MKKISTLFVMDYSKGHKPVITEEVREENSWVYDDKEEVTATRKWDGSACTIMKGKLYKRWDNKKGKPIPEGAIECQPADEVTGHHPYWVLCSKEGPSDKYFWEAHHKKVFWSDGTYELCGEKVRSNPEKLKGHRLFRHGFQPVLVMGFPFGAVPFSAWKAYLSDPVNDIEGIVFHHTDGRMCKLRKSDFNVKRG